ncbi:MAG: undecaprenyl-diphosphate phosphatase [Tannerellaceae bacterium]|jgi:undecaprenyl-diphosphatase|nr:undecaprenyl-diphosphate phosphatase [Tannerellaceae bacterium]
MNIAESLALGVVQGLTEFLPVSSSGHLLIGSALFGLEGEDNLAFSVAVHAATVLSTIVVLRREVSGLFRGFFGFRWNEDMQMVCKILLSMIPVAIVGVFFKDYVETLFDGSLLPVGCMLLLTAVLLTFSYYAKPHRKEKLSFRDAFVIGLAQALAVIPGLSRSGSTIATGLLLGNKKEEIAKFSFLMVIIPILGEALLDLMKGEFSVEASGISASALIAGFIAAFVTGTIACRWMIDMVKKGKLIYFAYYCVAAGLCAIVYSLIN